MKAQPLVTDRWPTCPRCNDLLPPRSRYCPECGTRLMEPPRRRDD